MPKDLFSMKLEGVEDLERIVGAISPKGQRRVWRNSMRAAGQKTIQKEAKKRRESIVAYREAGRDEQLMIEENELKLIEGYLPRMMSEEEVRVKVGEILKSGEFANFGMVMNKVMSELKGKADGGVVSKAVKELYQG